MFGDRLLYEAANGGDLAVDGGGSGVAADGGGAVRFHEVRPREGPRGKGRAAAFEPAFKEFKVGPVVANGVRGAIVVFQQFAEGDDVRVSTLAHEVVKVQPDEAAVAWFGRWGGMGYLLTNVFGSCIHPLGER